MNCTALVNADSCEVWAPTQAQAGSRSAAARIVGLNPEAVKVHSMFMGGGFGRRGGTDYVSEAVEIAKAMPGVPVQLTWTREDDMRHDLYRPASYVKFAGGVDADGWPVALTAKVACPSFMGGGRGGAVDSTAVEGIDTLEYSIPNLHVDWRKADAGIPTTFWRAVGYTQNTFFAESFIDELAAAGGKDPVELRRRMLAKSPRLLGVLNVVAEKANWGKAPAGRFQGVAVVNNIGSYTARDRRGFGERREAQSASRSLRGGLRACGEPGDYQTADRERNRVWVIGGVKGRDHHRQGQGCAGQL